jgi:hypothetical protein
MPLCRVAPMAPLRRHYNEALDFSARANCRIKPTTPLRGKITCAQHVALFVGQVGC